MGQGVEEVSTQSSGEAPVLVEAARELMITLTSPGHPNLACAISFLQTQPLQGRQAGSGEGRGGEGRESCD